MARAEVDDPDLIATLHGAGFEVVDRIRYYGPPAAEPRLAAAAVVGNDHHAPPSSPRGTAVGHATPAPSGSTTAAPRSAPPAESAP